MKIILYLAVLLIGNLPPGSGEELKCRVCKSETAEDDCTTHPNLIGAIECGKYGIKLTKELDSFNQLFPFHDSDIAPKKIELDSKLPKLKDLIHDADHFYVPIANHSGKLTKKIEQFNMAYQTYLESAENMKRSNETINAYEMEKSKMKNDLNILVEFNDILKDSLTPAVKTELQQINEVIHILRATTNTYKTCRDNFLRAVGKLPNSNNEMNKLIQTTIKKKSELLNSINNSQSDVVEELKNVVNQASDNEYKNLHNSAVYNQKMLKDPTTSSINETVYLNVCTIFLKNNIESLWTFKNKTTLIATLFDTMMPNNLYYVESKIKAETATLDDAKEKVIDAVAQVESAITNLTVTVKEVMNGGTSTPTWKWICFKEYVTNNGEVMINRGCTDGFAKSDVEDKFYVCDKDNGCNSSSNISIGFFTIFTSIFVALILRN